MAIHKLIADMPEEQQKLAKSKYWVALTPEDLKKMKDKTDGYRNLFQKLFKRYEGHMEHCPGAGCSTCEYISEIQNEVNELEK